MYACIFTLSQCGHACRHTHTHTHTHTHREREGERERGREGGREGEGEREREREGEERERGRERESWQLQKLQPSNFILPRDVSSDDVSNIGHLVCCNGCPYALVQH